MYKSVFTLSMMVVMAFAAAPVVTSIAVTEAIEGVAYSYTLRGSDGDGDSLSWSVKSGTTLPGWLSLDASHDPKEASTTLRNSFGVDADQLRYPRGVAVDSVGAVYAADTYNNRIQKWVPGATEGVTVAGGNGYGSDMNQLASPSGVTVDSSGAVYVADSDNDRIQKWAVGATVGVTVAGGNGHGRAADQKIF